MTQRIMGDFFNGWRHQAGYVTLALACLALSGWLRSGVKYDTISFNAHSFSSDILSIDSRIWILISTPGGGDNPLDFASGDLSKLNHFRVDTTGAQRRFDPQCYIDAEWRWDCFGLHFGSGPNKGMSYKPATHVTTCAFSYGYLITPLTLISAYLIFSKRLKTEVGKPSDVA